MTIHIDKMMGGRVRDNDGDNISGSTPPEGFTTWEQYIKYIIANNFAYPAQFNTWEDFITWLTNNVTTLPDGYTSWIQYINSTINNTSKNNLTRLIAGSVVWIENLDFQVSPLLYEILGQQIQSPEKLVTIPANVSADPMFAIIYADVFGNVGYILGTPAADPAIPIVNPATQLQITPVYIAGLGTSPANIINDVVYNQNIEWTTAKTEETDLTINFEDLTDPAVDTKHISLNIAADGGGEWVKGLLSAAPVIGQKTVVLTEPTAAFNWPLSELFASHKTDIQAANVRVLTWYNWQRLTGINIVLTNNATGVTHRFKAASTFTTEAFTVSALGFSVIVPDSLVASVTGAIPTTGTYSVEITGITKNLQYFTSTAAETFTPTAAKMTFTRSQAITVIEGNISLSLKSSIELLKNSGLLLELYNGIVKIGSLNLLLDNFYGFDPSGRYYGFNSALPEYQRITIPIVDFQPAGTLITKLVITPLNSWPNDLSFYIDNIVLQTGLQPDSSVDRYIDSILLDANGLLTLKRTGDLPDLTVQFSKVAKTNSYDDLADKPTIPAAQIQSDWNQATNTLADYIKNKPTIPTVNADYLKDWIEFEFRDIAAGTAQTYVLDLKALVTYTIDAAVLETDNGTLTGVAIKIGSTAVTSLSNVTVDTGADETAATGANSVAKGDKITLVTSTGYSGTPTLIRGKLNLTRT